METMVNAWLIIGDSHSRKTSTIRALSGVRQVQTNWYIHYRHGISQTYVHPAGLQEIGIPANQFIQAVTTSGSNYVIAALRYASAKGLPDAQAYLRDFVAAGWNIAGYAALGGRPAVPGFAGGVLINNPAQNPCNAIAGQLRGLWGIL